MEEILVMRAQPPAVRAALALALVSLTCSCAWNSADRLPRYQPPPPGVPAAEVVNFGLYGRVALIDGTATSPTSHTTRLVPGTHHIGIDCLLHGPGVYDHFIKHAALAGPFVAEQKYFVRCATEDGVGRAWLSDNLDELTLPAGFEELGVSTIRDP
jgi:hypothetical protein